MNRRWKLTAGVAAVVLACGATLVRCSVTGPSTSASESSVPAEAVPVTVDGPGPVREVAGVPVGFAGTRHGAVAAAVAYVAAPQRWLYFDDDEIVAALGVLASPAAVDRLTAEVVSEVGLARDALAQSAGRVWWLVHPLATRVEFFTPAAARVSVWTVTVLAATGVALPQSEWMTVTVDLVWSGDGDWQVDDVRSVLGPTPIVSPKDEPWAAERFDVGLDGFVRLDGGVSS